MRKSTRIVKRALALFLIVLMSINTFGAVVSDNDGSAFITKAEFDSLKNDFQSQIDQYNTSIDSKIDGAIASYLAGINVKSSGSIDVLSKGIFWSIGPFDRPRYKKGIPMMDVLYERQYWKSGDNYPTSFKLVVSWGDNFSNKVPVEDGAWGYTDVVISDVDASGQYGGFLGVYSKSSHFLSFVNGDQFQSSYNDGIAWQAVDNLYGAISGVQRGGDHQLACSFRAAKSGTGGLLDVALYVAASTAPGHTIMQSVVPGSPLLWNQNISCFAPIDYHCFNVDAQNVEADYVLDTDNRDEILYTEIDRSIANSASHRALATDKNCFYGSWPSVTNSSLNPWPSTSLSIISQVKAAVADRGSAGNSFRVINSTFPIDLNYGWCGQNDSTANTYFNWNYYFLPDVTFSTVSNWANLGIQTDSSVLSYVNTITGSNSIFQNSKGTSLLSLAAGLPVCSLEKKRKVNITGEFRKNCEYSFNSSTNTNVLNEGSLDDSDAYVVYAKLTPFDITSYPEDETDLIDISSDTKDVANVGKLQKCRIIRDGQLNIDITNESNQNKIVFLKWEKLSNWSDIGNTRKTGEGTNTDIRERSSNTGTITPPTWTYFGGGYLKLADNFKWEDAD